MAAENGCSEIGSRCPFARRFKAVFDGEAQKTGRGTGDEEFFAESAYKESGTITSLSEADGFIVIPEEVTQIPTSMTVTVTLI